ncbi:MAG: protoporphyrinogen oxidase HemJ [Pseudomonadota bacterium]
MYDWILVLHIAAWTSWMAGLFYLPRLFVYHAERAGSNAEMAETFSTMQFKLLRLIMLPAMIVTWATGLYLAIDGGWFSDGWMHAKITLVVAMSAFHGVCMRWHRALAAGTNDKTGRYFRIANEVPTVIFLLIVILAILKPF